MIVAGMGRKKEMLAKQDQLYSDECRRGQVTVEFALGMVVFLLLLLGILEIARAYFAHAAINHAAREGARLAIVDPNDTDGIVSRVISSASGLGLTNEDIQVSEPTGEAWAAGSPITITVSYDYITIIDAILPDLLLSTSSSMVIESVPTP